MASIVKSILEVGPMRMVAKWYQGQVYANLRKMGLRYEDIIIAEHPDYQAALHYIPQDEWVARQRRLMRASDLSFKHEELPPHIQAIQEPNKAYLADTMEQMRIMREEREQLTQG